MLRIGVIGAGKISERVQVPGFSRLRGCRVVAIADVNEKLARKVAGSFGIENVFGDYRDMLKMDGLDAVSVCTPNFLHCRMVVDSARAGKHVLVEKPMAASMNEVKRMVAAAGKARRVLMVEQSLRFNPLCEVAADLVAKKAVGKVLHVIGRFGHGGPEGWAPGAKWFFDEKRAFGGAMADLGIHLVDVMRFIVPTPVVEVSGMTATPVRRMKLEDLGVLNLRYTDGSLGQAAASWCLRPGGLRIEVAGTDGVLVLDGGELTLHRAGKAPRKPRVPAKSRLGGPLKYFVDCCRKGRRPFIDGVEGGRSLEIVIAGFKSQKSGHAVKLPPWPPKGGFGARRPLVKL